jgi:hypothetical protein
MECRRYVFTLQFLLILNLIILLTIINIVLIYHIFFVEFKFQFEISSQFKNVIRDLIIAIGDKLIDFKPQDFIKNLMGDCVNASS